MQYDKITRRKHNRIYAQWNGPSETKTKPENCKNCSSKCDYDCAQLQCTIQHRTVLIISPLTSRQPTSELWSLSGNNRGDYQNCSALYCVLKLCTVIITLRWAVLTVLWIGFCLTGLTSVCLDSVVSMCFLCLSCHTAYVLSVVFV